MVTELKKVNNDLLNDFKKLQVEKENIKKEFEKLEKKNKEFLNLIDSKQKEIENQKKEITELKKINKDLISKFNDLKKDFKILQAKKENMENEFENSKIKFQTMYHQEDKYNELKEKYDKKNMELEKIKENSDKSSKYENLQKEDFYDLIIKCNSINGLKNGWEVSMNEKGKKNYYEMKDNKYTKIGVIGSENRGKSTILSDLSKIELPTGYSIKTEGLSIKFPDLEKFKNRKFILLDSAGLEMPILNSKENYDNKENIEENMEKENDIFANKSRDIIQLELYLQNYIIKYSDILILILGKLTINEQKLLIKVKTHIKNLNRKEPLIVIHNLKEFETLSQVNNYISQILQYSSTFSLKDDDEINLDNEESGWKHFYEPKSEPKVYHLISTISDKEKFDPIDCIKNYFVEISETILEHPLKKGDIIDNLDLIQKDGKNATNKMAKISLSESSKQIILKRCLIDELGISFFKGNGFNPEYSYYLTETGLYIYVELPGKKETPTEDVEYENVTIDKQAEGSYTMIKISGIKKHNTEHLVKETIIHSQNKRQFGEFNIEIKLDKISLEDDILFKIENGCLLIVNKIKKKSNKRNI